MLCLSVFVNLLSLFPLGEQNNANPSFLPVVRGHLLHTVHSLSNTLTGNPLNRPSQLPDLAITNGSTSGIWAPALRYHNGTFYLVTTLVHDKRAPEDPSRWDNV